MPLEKLERYLLDPEHPVGRHKARVFRSAVAIEREDAAHLADELRRGVRSAPVRDVATRTVGDRTYRTWRVDMPVTGPTGRTKLAVTAWEMRNGRPWFVHARIAKRQPPEYAG